MQVITKALSLLLLFAAISQDCFAQRTEDHFMRRRVVNRIDLEEKINFPLIRQEIGYQDERSEFVYREGIVKALLSGLEKGTYVAYDPDNYREAWSAQEVEDRILEFENAYNQGSDIPDWEMENETSGIDEFEGDDWVEDEWVTDDFETGNDFPDESIANGGDQEVDLANFEMVLQFVEDWIYDKKLSDVVYDIQYVEILWVDPSGALPEKVLAVFKWDDIAETLDQTQWINRFNSAQNMSVKQLFDLRIFHSYFIDVSGEGMNSLEEAEKWRQRMVEFESHLYSN